MRSAREIPMPIILRSKSALCLVAAFAGLCFSINSIAAEPKLITQLTAATCASFFPPILNNAQLSPILAERSIEGQTICACAKSRVESDPRLSEYLTMDNATLAGRAQDERVRAYLVARVLQSLVQCLATELDLSLAASTAVK